mgnify:CR=1 FL=1
MIAVIDYGAGNIFSVKNALDYLGFDSLLTNKKEDINISLIVLSLIFICRFVFLK